MAREGTKNPGVCLAGPPRDGCPKEEFNLYEAEQSKWMMAGVIKQAIG